jgi:hypothetical protein
MYHAAAAAAELLQALDLLRDFNASGKRTLPEHVPTGFVKPRWRPHVFASHGVDRHFYELCTLAELRDRLRAGDMSDSKLNATESPKLFATEKKSHDIIVLLLE